MTTLPVKAVDSKGRVSLGREFADKLVFVKRIADGVVEIIMAEAVPAKEAWLHKNDKAYESVMRGLEQTGKGEFAQSPVLEADADLSDAIGD